MINFKEKIVTIQVYCSLVIQFLKKSNPQALLDGKLKTDHFNSCFLICAELTRKQQREVNWRKLNEKWRTKLRN